MKRVERHPEAGPAEPAAEVVRDEGGRFLAGGPSANPGGRPKMPEVVRSRIQALTVRSVEVLKGCLESKDEKVRLEAAKHILDRAYGRPSQSTELKIEGLDVAAEHLTSLMEAGQRRRALRRAGEDAVLIGEAGQA